jgi:LAO/AO transport system kinase
VTTVDTSERGAGLLDLLERAAAGSIPATSQLITAVEARSPGALAVLDRVYARGGGAHVVGITGAPGSGKSTLTTVLAQELRARGDRVAIVAVDPSSSLTGGAILGDRIRMTSLVLDPGVFVRSMSTRGALGGLARATTDAVAVLDATGWDWVIVETVGVGQAEVEIAQLARTTVVVSVPGLGDDIQAIKAGLLEVADVHVVNKIDRPDANRTRKELLSMLHLGPMPGSEDWQVPVLGTSASRGEGVEELADVLVKHREWHLGSPRRAAREREAALARIQAIAKELVAERIGSPSAAPDLEATLDAVLAHRLTPAAAAELLIDRLPDRPSDHRSIERHAR